MTSGTTDRPGGPPVFELIIPEVIGRTDTGYALRVHLVGLRGTWHRLWAMLVLAEQLGDDPDDGVRVVRGQFEQQLGRSMSVEEWSQLSEHAKQHAAKNPLPA